MSRKTTFSLTFTNLRDIEFFFHVGFVSFRLDFSAEGTKFLRKAQTSWLSFSDQIKVMSG